MLVLENSYRSKQSPARRIAGTSLAHLAGMGLLIMDRVIVLGLMARLLSPRLFSDWMVMLSVSGYARNTNLGLGVYYSNVLSMHMSKKEHDAFAWVAVKGLTTLASLVALFSASTIIAVANFPVHKLLGLSGMEPKEAKFVLGMLMLSLIINEFNGFLNLMYRSVMALERAQWALNLRFVAEILLICGTLFAGGGILGVAAVRVIGAFLLLGFYGFDLKRMLCIDLGIWRPVMLKEGVEDIGKSIALFWVQSMRSWLSSGTVALVSYRMGSVAILPYTTTLYIANLAIGFIGSVSSGLWQEFGHWTWRDMNIAKTISLRAIRFVMGSGVILGISFVYLARSALDIWLGEGSPHVNSTIIILQCVYIISDSARIVPYNLLLSQNRIRILTISSCIGALLGLSAVLPSDSGIIGLAGVLPIANVVGYGIPIWVSFCRFLNIKSLHIWQVLRGALLLAIVMGGALQLLTMVLAPRSAGILMVLSILIFAILLWLTVVLGPKERRTMIDTMSDLFGKLSGIRNLSRLRVR
jgi:hypothetical protein